MPLTRTETFTAPATTTPWNCDPSIAPFNLNVNFAVLGGAAVSYKLQYSYDVLGPTDLASAASWYDSVEIPAATTVDAAQQFTAPITMVRAVIASLSGGSLKMTMLQGMSTN